MSHVLVKKFRAIIILSLFILAVYQGTVTWNPLLFLPLGTTFNASTVTTNRELSAKLPWKHRNISIPCPQKPPNLKGSVAVSMKAPTFADTVLANPGLEPGGFYQPPNCKAKHRAAIIIPYRDREHHLKILLHNLHPMLVRQQLEYFILVVEQKLPTRFNRGMLLNIGAVEASKLWDFDCFIFHDVDLIPENDNNLYTCPKMPRHMSAAVDKFNYTLPYTSIIGGVAAIPRDQFLSANGYSNAYFGWGGEDDDLSNRLKSLGLTVTRYSMNIARYKMIKHGRDKLNDVNPNRLSLLARWERRQANDGLNSLCYEVLSREFREAYTWILIDVNKTCINNAQTHSERKYRPPHIGKDSRQKFKSFGKNKEGGKNHTRNESHPIKT